MEGTHQDHWPQLPALHGTISKSYTMFFRILSKCFLNFAQLVLDIKTTKVPIMMPLSGPVLEKFIIKVLLFAFLQRKLFPEHTVFLYSSPLFPSRLLHFFQKSTSMHVCMCTHEPTLRNCHILCILKLFFFFEI